ncbi:MAG: Na+:solute symporter [Sedimentisphaerales bacterium]|nr:Na+:solute symporter [Sedimentisphaerales bacterium]
MDTLRISLSGMDYFIVGFYFAFAIIVGILTRKLSGDDMRGYFLSGQRLSWWLLGTSMVATTFALDTPLYVAGWTREFGISKNWEWWIFLFGGMFTTFFFAKLWRRSNVLNDAEFIDIRYSGKSGAFLRGFRALYMGFIMNMLVIGSQLVAISKVGTLILGISTTNPNYSAWCWAIAVVCGFTALFYCYVSGFGAIVITDFVQFGLSMAGAILLAVYACRQPEVGGIGNMIAQLKSVMPDKLDFAPTIGAAEAGKISLLVVIGYGCIRWWSQVYGGAEPGGQAHVAQRMLAARNEKHALLASLWFNFANYALKPLPWIITALATLLIFPLDKFTDHESVYLSTINFVPMGLRGLVVASLFAAFMSTVDTRINLGASYFVNDFYKPFLAKDKSDHHYVIVSRWVSVIQLIVGLGMLLIVSNMRSVFFIYAGLGSGAGLVYILRFYWWRINAWSEFAAMATAFVSLIVFRWGIYGSEAEFNRHGFEYMFISFFIVTTLWVIITLLTKPCDERKLKDFYQKVRPSGPFWKPVSAETVEPADTRARDNLKVAFVGWLASILATLGCLFGLGKLLLKEYLWGVCWLVVCALSGVITLWSVRKLTNDNSKTTF